MNKKRTILPLCTVCLTILLIGAAPLTAGPAKGPCRPCRLEGAWIVAVYGPEPTWTDTLVMQQSFVPLDPFGRRLLYTIDYVNVDDTFGGAFLEVHYMSEAIGEAMRTGRNTYDYTLINYGAEIKTGKAERDAIKYIYVQTGTLECVDNDTFTVVAYGAVYDASSDADNDGFPDEGAIPLFDIGELTGITGKRVPMLPPGTP